MKRIQISALILVTMLMVSTSTQAIMILDPVRVEVNGIKYDVTTVIGTFNELENELTDINWAPWWGNRPLAEDFAKAVSGSLGYPNGGDGPFFAYKDDTTRPNERVNVYACLFSDALCVNPNDLATIKSGEFASNYYAKASVVPVPAAAWLFGSALLGLVGYSRRKAKNFPCD